MTILFRNSRIKLSAGMLFWREVGQGTPIIFLHGSWDEGGQWVGVMERLGADYQCFAPDLLGFSESDRPNVHYSLNLQVECLQEYFQALKLDGVYLVGHSLGGWIATRYGLAHPEQVKGLILLAPEGVDVPELKDRWKSASWLVGPKSFWVQLLKVVLPVARWMGKGKPIEALLERRSHFLQFFPACQMLFLRRAREIQAEYVQDELPTLKVPSLLLSGLSSHSDRPEIDRLNQVYSERVPNLKEQTLPTGDPDWPRSHSDAVAQAIREFVQAIETDQNPSKGLT
ncbi:alpha/beta hydrolase [Roseofilum sp. BLCC_M154]|uniref:Alpha/beta hydrolase n=1 Tax=Roseofilum acuticapitatum BLCC-M154 TaxID=3022444 RepID=A0ABT7APQ3_9CYAN|nr:alpha/beta hydrolase [Roseofilum acuticapitatum]MDJ1168866.1 alpha/beta hydrolase [Roseofilum acuticapitatum BLCC-M154]